MGHMREGEVAPRRSVTAAIAVAQLISAAWLAAAHAQQQQEPQPPTFTTGTRTVAVYATVTNAEGRLVPDLSRDDFAIDDNGKRQVLTLFSNDIQPITVVMLLDRSGSMVPNFDARGAGGGGVRARDGAGRQGAHRQLRDPHPGRPAGLHVGS